MLIRPHPAAPFALVCLLSAVLNAASAWAAGSPGHRPLVTPDEYDILYPDDEPHSQAEIELGKTLFFDPRLSQDGSMSCASCHDPDLGFGDGQPLSVGVDGEFLSRHTPSLYNLAWGVLFLWDGRSPSLEAQALMPIRSRQEMAVPTHELELRLQSVPEYRESFALVYGDGAITAGRVGRALAAFERSLVVMNTPFDHYLGGDESAMDDAAKRGLELFSGKAECVRCHDGPNFTDDSFHNIGHRNFDDPGRGGVIGDPSLHGAFKTPGLRNVALHPPYFHDGSQATLEDVLHFYNRGGDSPRHRSRLIRPLHLSDAEIADLLSFLHALTEPIEIKPPKIP